MATRPRKTEEPAIHFTENPPTEDIVINLDDDIMGEELASTRLEQDELEPATTPLARTSAPASDNEDDDPLTKAVEAAQRAEELARTRQRERDDALRLAQERQTELTKERGDREEAQYGSILTAMAAEQSALDKAKSDYANFAAAGDWPNATEAQAAISKATARLDRLEDTKVGFDTKREADKTTVTKTERRPANDFESRIASLPDEARVWLRAHPEFVNDQSKTDALSGVHNYLVSRKNLTQFTPAYFEALDEEFGFKQRQEPDRQQDRLPPQRRSIPVSAPVSRDVPTASGTRSSNNSMTLTAEERAIARNSFGPVNGKDLTNAEKEYLYAKNKQKYQKSLNSGEYRDARHQR